MRIKSVRIQNFRSFEDETVEFGNYTCLLGPNGAGKSNVIHALNVFFRDTQTPGLDFSLVQEDFHCKNTSEPVQITVTFTDLGEQALADFEHYCRQGQLVVSAVARFESSTGRAEVLQYGQRLVMREFRAFFEADKERRGADALKQEYTSLRSKFPELPPPGAMQQMRDALHSFEESHPELCKLTPSADQFYGATKGQNLLANHVLWVYLPAVKELSSEDREDGRTALGKLLARTVRAKTSFDTDIAKIRDGARGQYLELLRASEDALSATSRALRARLSEWAHPDATLRLEWDQDDKKAVQIAEPYARAVVGEPGFEGDLARFGHGLQRAYLLALLHELATTSAEGEPTLILACEEPELYQHPPQARHLYDVLRQLTQQNAQVISCTHSPYFVSGQEFESVRLVRKTAGKSEVLCTTCIDVADRIRTIGAKAAATPSGALAKIHQALHPELSEMFFAPRLVLVEGPEDVAYLTTYLSLLGRWEDYRCTGCHIVPSGGKSAMIQPISIAQCLSIPVFVVFDADGDEEQEGKRRQHEADNTHILRLMGVKNPVPFPSAPAWHHSSVMWDLEIGEVVKREIGETEWQQARVQASEEFGHTAGLQKNSLHIARSLEIAWQAGLRSDSLKRACECILEFGCLVG